MLCSSISGEKYTDLFLEFNFNIRNWLQLQVFKLFSSALGVEKFLQNTGLAKNWLIENPLRHYRDFPDFSGYTLYIFDPPCTQRLVTHLHFAEKRIVPNDGGQDLIVVALERFMCEQREREEKGERDEAHDRNC